MTTLLLLLLTNESSMRYQASQVSYNKLPVHHTEGTKKMKQTNL